MKRPARYEICTIWATGDPDPVYGDYTYGDPAVYRCSVRAGGTLKLTDSRGQEFTPQEMYWVKPGDLINGTAEQPRRGWMIARGDHRAVNDPITVKAEQIQGLTIHSHAKFGERDSWVLGT